MKKWKQFLAGMVWVLCFSMLAACGCGTGDNTTNTENTTNTQNATTIPNTQNNGVNRTEIIEDTNTVDGTEGGLLNDAGNAVGDVVDGVGEAGKDVIDGVQNGVNDMTGNTQNTENRQNSGNTTSR